MTAELRRLAGTYCGLFAGCVAAALAGPLVMAVVR